MNGSASHDSHHMSAWPRRIAITIPYECSSRLQDSSNTHKGRKQRPMIASGEA